MSRDLAFKRIYRLWQDCIIGQTLSSDDIKQLILYNYGEDLENFQTSENNNNQMFEEEQLKNDRINKQVNTHQLLRNGISHDFKNIMLNQHNKSDSITSFLTCPQTDKIDSPFDNNSMETTDSNQIMNMLDKKFNFLSMNSLYIWSIFALVSILLIMHLILLYKIYIIQEQNAKSKGYYNQQLISDLTFRLFQELSSHEKKQIEKIANNF